MSKKASKRASKSKHNPKRELRQYVVDRLKYRNQLNLPPGWRDIGVAVLPPKPTLEEWKAKQDNLFL